MLAVRKASSIMVYFAMRMTSSYCQQALIKHLCQYKKVEVLHTCDSDQVQDKMWGHHQGEEHEIFFCFHHPDLYFPEVKEIVPNFSHADFEDKRMKITGGCCFSSTDYFSNFLYLSLNSHTIGKIEYIHPHPSSV